MAKTETEVLVEMLESSRELTNSYLKKLENEDVYKVFTVEGKQLNSVLWLMAHVAVSENWLLLVSTGGERVKIPWARQFGLGSEIPNKEDYPSVTEIREVFDLVHQTAMTHICQLSDKDLSKPTATGTTFGGEDSIRSIIKHAIRHESIHAGHLGWLCKLFGIKLI